MTSNCEENQTFYKDLRGFNFDSSKTDFSAGVCIPLGEVCFFLITFFRL